MGEERGAVGQGGRWERWNIRVCEEGLDRAEPPGPADEERLRATRSAIPRDVETVLDAGCGSGRLSNGLAGTYRVVALDYVSKALQCVHVPKVRGDLCHLPFPDMSFDLALCCEVLEHLPPPMLERAVRELVRVSKRYVLVTVPNDQDLEAQLCACPRCKTVFHPVGHLARFTKPRMEHLFGKRMECVVVREVFPVRGRAVSPLAARWRPQRFGRMWPGRGLVCPACGFSGEGEKAEGLLLFAWQLAVRAANFLANPVTTTKGRWLLALYRKSTHDDEGA